MIELNLIEAASQSVPQVFSTQTFTAPAKEKSSLKLSRIFIAVAVVLVLIVGSLVFFKVAGLPQMFEGVLPTPVLDVMGIVDPSRSGPEMNVRRTTQMTTAGGGIERRKAEEQAAALRQAQANSPERVVQAIQPGMFQGEKRSDYASMFPMAKVAYQKSMASQIFAFINAVTPDGISFAELTFVAPNYYSVHGVAETPVVLRNYLDRLKMGSSEFKTPELPENAPATAVTAYGILNSKPEMANANAPFVKDAEVSKEMEALRGLDANGKMHFSGLKNPKVADFGVYKSYTYNVTTKADFQLVLKFLEALSKSPVRVGVERVKMIASGKSGISTAMTLVIYTSN